MLPTTTTPLSGTPQLLIPFLSLIAGILLSIFVSFATRWAYDTYKEPELRVNDTVNLSDGDGYNVSLIEIVNEGETAATNCTPTVAITEIESETRRDSPYADNKPLLSEPLNNSIVGTTFWLSAQDESGKTINKDSSAWACICRISGENDDSIEIPSEGGWGQPLAVLLKTQTPYNIEFQATSKECSSDPEQFELRTSRNSLDLIKIS